MRAKLWFKCAAMHDPVCPKQVSPAIITWEAKNRDIQLVIERGFKGHELVKRMRGWVTVEPLKVLEIVERYGKFIVDDAGELYVEISDEENFQIMKESLYNEFGDEILLEKL